MHKTLPTFVLAALTLLISQTSLAGDYIERNFRTHPVQDAEIDIAIQEIKNRVGKTGLEVLQIVFASGTQEYQYVDGQWKKRGPKADLFPANQRNRIDALTKSGTHYQDFEKPGWKFLFKGVPVEVIASSAKVIPGASDQDIPWLHVQTADNKAGVTDIFRIHTRAGKAPEGLKGHESLRFGSSYETIYVALSPK